MCKLGNLLCSTFSPWCCKFLLDTKNHKHVTDLLKFYIYDPGYDHPYGQSFLPTMKMTDEDEVDLKEKPEYTQTTGLPGIGTQPVKTGIDRFMFGMTICSYRLD